MRSFNIPMHENIVRYFFKIISRFFVLGVLVTKTASISTTDVCFGYLGCFPQSFPWVSVARPVPAPVHPDNINTHLYLFSRRMISDTETKNFSTSPIKLEEEVSLEGYDYNKYREKTVFIIHGFASSTNSSPWMTNIKDNYLKSVDANVFLVDWGEGASFINYLQVVANTRVVGMQIARFAESLIDEGLRGAQIYFIGHSLGAHICGYAAKELRKRSTIVGRITGLDPAQPAFEGLPEEVRLAKGDASFMDIIHSDAKLFLPFGGFGYIRPLGDVDFYLNLGFKQPGCLRHTADGIKVSSIYELYNIPVEVISRKVSCSHERAHAVFTYAIDPDIKCKFTGYKVLILCPFIVARNYCFNNNCIDIGLDTPNFTPRGSFQVKTTGRAPYCKNFKNKTESYYS